MTRFVAWLNGLSVFQIKVHNRYRMQDFDDDLRTVLRRAGCKGEKIAFIMDESSKLRFMATEEGGAGITWSRSLGSLSRTMLTSGVRARSFLQTFSTLASWNG